MKIQRILKTKNLVEQVKEASTHSEAGELKKREFNKIFCQICSIFSNPDSTSKKNIAIAIQAFKMLVFSQFIVQFNEKAVLIKLLDLLKL